MVRMLSWEVAGKEFDSTPLMVPSILNRMLGSYHTYTGLVFFTPRSITSYIILPPFLNISHIVFSTNINARLEEGCETKEKKENQIIFSLPIRLLPKSKGLVGTCAMYGGKVSKLMGVGANTYLYFEIFFRNLYSLC